MPLSSPSRMPASRAASGSGKMLVDPRDRVGLEGIDQAQDGVAAGEGQQGGFGIRHVGQDALVRQVILVGKVLAGGRGLQVAAQAHHVAILPVPAGGHARQDQAGAPAGSGRRY